MAIIIFSVPIRIINGTSVLVRREGRKIKTQALQICYSKKYQEREKDEKAV